MLGTLGSAVFVLLLLRLLRQEAEPKDCSGEWNEEWFAEFSAFRYLPMQRLLHEDEENFFVERAGRTGLAEFRAERRRLFREYLGMIREDFRILSQGARRELVNAAQDKSGDLQHLMRLQVQFRYLMLQAELRLGMHWLGIRPIDASRLVDALQGFEFTLREVRLATRASS
jgi:hypothetical protein